MAGKQLVQGYAKPKNIGRWREFFKSAFLWRNITTRASNTICPRRPLPTRDSKIAQYWSSIDDDNVGRLHIEM
jgi:hypothetical protein